MNKHEQPIGVDPKIKKEINEEGFEGNVAVLIGKKEDMPNLEKKLESEGRAIDLETYLQMHKEILISSENMAVEKKIMRTIYTFDKGDYLLDDDLNLYYIDSANNLAMVKIDFEKIDTLKNESKTSSMSAIIKERLNKLGFKNRIGGPNTAGVKDKLEGMIYRQESRIKEQNKQKAENKFNF